MATFYKTLNIDSDIASTRTLIHESIPLTGSIVSGTYSEANIKTYTHGMFQSVYDYPYLSSSANHIFDISCGYSPESSLSGATGASQESKKINIYNQFRQILAGYSTDGTLADITDNGTSTGNNMPELFILPFSRLLVKDEIKKGSFVITLGTSTTYATPFATTASYGDYGATTTYKANSPAGEFAPLYSSPSSTTPVGHVFYQAGVVLISGSVFGNNFSGSSTVTQTLVSSSINEVANQFRRRIQNVQFNNTTELNSTIYFCRANNKEFNYSSNPTYVTGSQIVVKNVSTDNPVAYVTTVGLYDSTNNLVAVAKLSEPLRKDPSTELTLRVRLDY
jgi:hypothetical protein